jgi:DNA-binding MarR family transcriptional regulator
MNLQEVKKMLKVEEVKKLGKEVNKPSEIGRSQAIVLAYLTKHAGHSFTQDEISKATKKSNPHINKIMWSLLEKGCVARYLVDNGKRNIAYWNFVKPMNE